MAARRSRPSFPAELKARSTMSTEQVAATFGLKGLGSADFLVDGEEA